MKYTVKGDCIKGGFYIDCGDVYVFAFVSRPADKVLEFREMEFRPAVSAVGLVTSREFRLGEGQQPFAHYSLQKFRQYTYS